MVPARRNHLQHLTCTSHFDRSRRPQQAAKIDDEILRPPLIVPVREPSANQMLEASDLDGQAGEELNWGGSGHDFAFDA